MATIIKPEELDFRPDAKSPEDFSVETLAPRLSTLAKSEKFMFDIRKLQPDKYSFPYHFHKDAEELIKILSGSTAGFFTLNAEKSARAYENSC
ncbi:hypothetical protein SAMN05444280_13414 [Tangfeifania diversioriginum]|uniref:Cupin fold metalloprotein, WbuC family n=1 Tax=Tangfeifania diversioriginum TaxID=1168035 RepID=A0A1M6MMU0_9BACT|nr:hypothetical protein [Tangfeifania diversioriginum]SHJ84593.1 hypothetical protein SAMN05444280_13414 [Tangfeifania diversioriginum]